MSIAEMSTWDRIKLSRAVIRENPYFNLSHSSILRSILENDSPARQFVMPVAVMARDAGMQDKTARNAIKDLLKWGIIRRTKVGYTLADNAYSKGRNDDDEPTVAVGHGGRTANKKPTVAVGLEGRTGSDKVGCPTPDGRLSHLLRAVEPTVTVGLKEYIYDYDGAASLGGPPIKSEEEQEMARLAYEARMEAYRIKTEPARLKKLADEAEADELRRSVTGVKDGDRPLAPNHPPREAVPDFVEYSEISIGAFVDPEEQPRRADSDC